MPERSWSWRANSAARVAGATALCMALIGGFPSVLREARAALDPSPSPDCLIPGFDDTCERWVARFDGPAGRMDSPTDGLFTAKPVVVSPDGASVYVTGISGTGTAESWDVVTLAYDSATGQQRWTARFNGIPGYPQAMAQSLTTSSDGGTVFVLVNLYGATCRAAVIAYDAASGATRWISDVAEPSEDCAISALAVATVPVYGGAGAEPTERLFYAGYRSRNQGEGRPTSGFVSALEAGTGADAWTRYFAGHTRDGAMFMAVGVSPDGRTVFGAGGENRPSGHRNDYTTVAYHAATGEQRWEAHDPVSQPDGLFGNNGVIDIAVSPDSRRVFVAGSDPIVDSGVAESGLLTFAHDVTTGERLWGARYAGPPDDPQVIRPSNSANLQGSLAVSSDGSRVMLVGEHVAPMSGYQHGWSLISYDSASGQQVWEEVFREPVYRAYTFLGFQPALATRGDMVYVTGVRLIHNVARTVTAGYDVGTGQQRWMARFARGASYPGGITAGPQGSVFVAAVGRAVNLENGEVDVSVPGDSWDIEVLGYGTSE